MNVLGKIRWHPEIGDHSFMGWFTVVAYGVAALIAVRVWWKRREGIWLLVALGMAGLCLNKQLDLQSLVTEIGRNIAHHGGWYEHRRDFQKWFVLGALAIAGVVGLLSFWRFHRFWLRHKLLLAGGLFLVTFIVVRAISFHHLEVFLGSRVGGVKMNWALELGGIFLIGLACVMEMRPSPDKPGSP